RIGYGEPALAGPRLAGDGTHVPDPRHHAQAAAPLVPVPVAGPRIGDREETLAWPSTGGYRARWFGPRHHAEHSVVVARFRPDDVVRQNAVDHAVLLERPPIAA